MAGLVSQNAEKIKEKAGGIIDRLFKRKAKSPKPNAIFKFKAKSPGRKTIQKPIHSFPPNLLLYALSLCLSLIGGIKCFLHFDA